MSFAGFPPGIGEGDEIDVSAVVALVGGVASKDLLAVGNCCLAPNSSGLDILFLAFLFLLNAFYDGCNNEEGLLNITRQTFEGFILT